MKNKNLLEERFENLQKRMLIDTEERKGKGHKTNKRNPK
jgi:hypothetical protein